MYGGTRVEKTDSTSGTAYYEYGVANGSMWLRVDKTTEVVSESCTIEFKDGEVLYKGATPYVMYDGSYHTPAVTVKDGSGKVLPASQYTVSYLSNLYAETGYVSVKLNSNGVVTYKSFKIYLPPTTATSVENVSNGVKVTWSKVDGAAGYVIYRRAWNLISSGWTTFERWNNTTDTSWVDTKVYAGTRYQYGVKAYIPTRTDEITGKQYGGAMDNYNLGNVGPLKTTVRITTRVFKEVSGETKQVAVTWAPSGVFTGYQLQIVTDTAFTKNVQTVKITNKKTTQYVFKNLKAKKSYSVRIRSYHLFEGMTYYGGWSEIRTVKTK